MELEDETLLDEDEILLDEDEILLDEDEILLDEDDILLDDEITTTDDDIALDTTLDLLLEVPMTDEDRLDWREYEELED